MGCLFGISLFSMHLLANFVSKHGYNAPPTNRSYKDSLQSLLKDQGPVVQSIVSLTSSLRGQLVKCLTTL